MAMPHIYKMVEVSTAHICESTSQRLNASANTLKPLGEGIKPLPMTVLDTGYGWIVWIPNTYKEYEDLPADLYHIFEYAKAHDCEFAMIDVDAEVSIDLPVYE